VVVATTTLSYVCGVAVIALFGPRVRDWVMKRLLRREVSLPQGRLRQIWNRYGLIGLGLVAPMTTGAQIGAALGLALNAHPARLFVALCLGGLVWSIILTMAVGLGVQAVR
jgi:hypothetical protein